jgi:fatty-acyl-CoA synthase
MRSLPRRSGGGGPMTAAAAIGKAGGGNAAWVRALGQASAIDAHPHRVFPDVVEELAIRYGAAPALLSTRESYSFEALAARTRRYSRWATAQGLEPGAVVALLMTNRPDYLAAWIGLTRMGVVVALLNTNLTGAALAHSAKVAAPTHAIVEDRLLDAWLGAAPLLDPAPALWVHGEAGRSGGTPLAPALEALAGDPLGPEKPAVTTASPALLVYTSGTTGLPKAARVSHHRVMMWSHWFAGMIDTGPGDRMYDCLPLYHSVGGVVATGSPLVNGGSVVIAEKFSARSFWEDVVRWDCTLVQYIGELCRYLVKAPPKPSDTAHRVRLACGNGLRADVWDAFRDRFAIPKILEFYAATEANFSLYNIDGKAGAIGRIPSFMAARFPAAIVRHDVETGLPARGPDGFCIRCAPDEAGEAIGRISADEAARAGRFEGYTSDAESERKVLRDVFAKGDAWFRTGDLMRLDRQGFFTFVDRIGDTFRWKGENVATTEVAEAVASCPGVAEAMVYGVAVPGADGKAGMAALVVEDNFDPATLHAHLAGRLPAYARPLFLRFCERFAMTDTFKQKKGALAQQGFDPAATEDPLFFADAGKAAYVPLDPALHAALLDGRMRV